MPTMSETTRALGWQAADFELEGTDGKQHRLSHLRGEKGTVVVFMCNHCPYVKAVTPGIVADAAQLAREGIATIAVMPNDTESYPADSFDNMKQFAEEHGFRFPYVIDRTQEVAKAYGAVCTPDFFGFDRDLKLRYRGRIQEMRGAQVVPDAKRELLEAMRQVAATGRAPEDQNPSIGCSIKWRG